MLNATINRSPLTRSARLVTALAALLVAVPLAAAQSSFFTFSGSVLDSTNRVVPDTALVLTNTGSQAKYEVRSDRTGHFQFVGLPSGEYALEVKVPGFATLKDTVTIAGRNVDRTLMLQLGLLEETITVSYSVGEKPVAVSPEVQEERRQRGQEARQRAQERLQRALDKCSGTSAGPIGGNILQPTKVTDVRPAYPEQLRSAKIGGIVTMEAVIGPDGNVRDVRVLSSADPDLESAAVEAVRQWQYSPTLLNCTPTEVRMKVTSNFTIQP